MESWQIFHAALKGLPTGTLQNIYRRSARLVQYWAADPKYCETHKRNPLDRIRIMLQQLDLAGCGNFSRWAIDYLAEPLGGCFAYKEAAKADKDIDGEIADSLVAIGKLADEIRHSLADDGKIDEQEKSKIRDYALGAKRQIAELMDAAGIED